MNNDDDISEEDVLKASEAYLTFVLITQYLKVLYINL